MEPCIYLAGNISEGYEAFGPFENFDEACEAFDGVEGWVMELKNPKDYKARYNIDPQ
jgi:hypothetical protein